MKYPEMDSVSNTKSKLILYYLWLVKIEPCNLSDNTFNVVDPQTVDMVASLCRVYSAVQPQIVVMQDQRASIFKRGVISRVAGP